MLKQFVIIIGDLKIDRLNLKPETREGKILKDFEDVHHLRCMITKPTGIAQTLATLLDEILCNKPQVFKKSGTVGPEISDHRLIYGIMFANIVEK